MDAALLAALALAVAIILLLVIVIGLLFWRRNDELDGRP